MCKFFSFVGDGYGNFRYFDWAVRKRIIAGELKFAQDSHTSILTHFGVHADKQDRWSAYEYNPLTNRFKVDSVVDGHDAAAALSWVESLDWRTVVEPLRVKPIVHPFKVTPPEKITEEHLDLLRSWALVSAPVRASVWDSVWDSVGDPVLDSVWSSVRDSVWASVRDSVRDSVLDSVRDLVRDSVGASVRASVRDLVLDSVLDSMGAYISSFIAADYKYDFSPGTRLWEMGLVPSNDGKVWRLHGGPKGRVFWTGTLDAVGKDAKEGA